MSQHLQDNRPRVGGAGRGHVESWFVRANHPTEPLSIWLKITVLRLISGDAVAEAWVSLFDGVNQRTFAAKSTVPLDQASLGPGLHLDVAGCSLHLHARGGSASGRIQRGHDSVEWDLAWMRHALGEPLCLLPSRRLIDGPLPRFKLLTPTPVALFSGGFSWEGRETSVNAWTGMQGHNWGAEHSQSYSWGQCVFCDDDGQPVAMAEGFSGRVRVAGATTPVFSALVVRRGKQTYRFDGVFDVWRQRARRDDLTWNLRIRGRAGNAMIRMAANPSQMVCLAYRNPTDRVSYCLNSKLARVTLRVNPVNDEGFECTSAHGGALEFLQSNADPRLPDAV